MAISSLGAEPPRRYSDIGYKLLGVGVLSEEEASLIKSLAVLRIVLVYGYASIDREKS